jgi:lipopolysaccharide export system permease protein
MSDLAMSPTIRRLGLSITLSGYIARQYLVWFICFLSALTGIILLVSTVDLLDRVSNRDVALGVVVELALLKLPFLSQEVMPFTVLFASMTTFWRLTRSNELVVARAAGISVWQFLLPALTMGLLIAVFTVAVLNPLGSILLNRFEQVETKYIRHQTSLLALSSSGLWLRQADDGGQSVIHAEKVSPNSMILHRVIIFRYAEEDRFINRIDADKATLLPGAWRLAGAQSSAPGSPTRQFEEMTLPTDLTAEKIKESFAAPETISFWSLPHFIELMEAAGFSALRHKLQLHRLLAVPVLFSAMILLAATFSLRPQRRGRVGLVILAGVMTGFLLYFLSNFVFALGLSAKIPVILAAWAPAGISMLLGIAMLLHLEDG